MRCVIISKSIDGFYTIAQILYILMIKPHFRTATFSKKQNVKDSLN